MAKDVMRRFVEELVPIWRARRAAKEASIGAKSARIALAQLAPPPGPQQVEPKRPVHDLALRVSELL